MTESEIVKIANDVLDETDMGVAPINVVTIARYYGFSVYQANLGDDTSGLIMVDDKPLKNYNTNKLIMVHQNHSVGRKRFTVAHELGHYFLKGRPQKCFAHRDIAGKYNEEEKSANSFASALLMPENEIKSYIEKFQGMYGNDHPEFLIIKSIALNFNVSEDAAKVRLRKLGFVN